jgi:hypothetical protein
LPQAKARGAICVSVLESELSDTLSLDYQIFPDASKVFASNTNPAEIFRYCTRFSPRLATLASHIPPHLSTPKEHSPLPLGCVIVAYLARLIKQFSLLLSNEKLPCLKQRRGDLKFVF